MRVIQKALTFDDVLLLPAHSRVLPRDVSLKTRISRKLGTGDRAELVAIVIRGGLLP